MQSSNNEKTQFQSQGIMHSKWLLCQTTHLMLRKQNILPLDLYVHFLEALLREVGHQYLVKTSKVNLLSGTKKVCSVYDFLTLACKFLSGHLKTINDFLLFINCGMIFHSKSSHILQGISLYRSKVLHKLNDRRVY